MSKSRGNKSRTRKIEEEMLKAAEGSNTREGSNEMKIRVADRDQWRIYENISRRDVIFSSLSYRDVDNLDMDRLAERIPDNFQLIFYSDYLDDTRENEYRAGVFVNNETREIIIASSGTRFNATVEGAQDLYANLHLALEQSPRKLNSVKKLNQIILDSLGEEAANYTLHYTGHSLGASLSDMAAADMAIRMRNSDIPLIQDNHENRISTFTFENPGARTIIKEMYRESGINPREYSKDVDYKGINHNKNCINQASNHAGKMWEVTTHKPADLSSIMSMFIGYLGKTMQGMDSTSSRTVGRLVETGSYGTPEQQLDSHNLSHLHHALYRRVDSDVRDAKELKREERQLSNIVNDIIRRSRAKPETDAAQAKIEDPASAKGVSPPPGAARGGGAENRAKTERKRAREDLGKEASPPPGAARGGGAENRDSRMHRDRLDRDRDRDRRRNKNKGKSISL